MGTNLLRHTALLLLSPVLFGGFARQHTPPAATSGSPRRGVCVAVMLPSVQGAVGSATEVASAVRDLFGSFLTGPSIHAVPIDARLADQGVEEAKQKECNNVLIATLVRKHSGGGGWSKALGQAAAVGSWYVPYGGTVASNVARGVSIATAQAVSSLASETKAKDEMTLEYRVLSTDGNTRVPSTTEKAKAKSDGEDLLTPIVERASQAIANVVSK